MCAQRITHPSLTHTLTPLLTLEHDVHTLARAQLRSDVAQPRDDDDEHALTHALRIYTFYQCAVCARAYCGGARVCAADGDDDGEHDNDDERGDGECDDDDDEHAVRVKKKTKKQMLLCQRYTCSRHTHAHTHTHTRTRVHTTCSHIHIGVCV